MAYARRRRIRKRSRRAIKRRYTRRVKRKASTRKRKRVGNPIRVIMYNKLLQQKVRSYLTYVDTKTMSPTTGAAVHTFRLNSMFDCDQTGGGHQPAYRDQWAVLYKKYRVISTKWTIKMQSMRAPTYQTALGSDAVTRPYVDASSYDHEHNPAIFCWEVNTDTAPQYTVASDLNFLRETGQSQNNFQYVMQTVGGGEKTLRGSALMKTVMDDPIESQGAWLMGSNPPVAADVFLHVSAMSKDGTTTSRVRFDITMKFLVEFSDPDDVGPS